MNEMKITHPIPATRISAYVKNILVIENDTVTKPFILPLFANGTPTLLFSTVAGQIGNNEHHLSLFGQTLLPQQMHIRDHFKLIAYFLYPHALTTLFKIPVFELTDRPIALDLLTEGRLLPQEQLLNSSSIEQMLQLIDEYLYRRILTIKQEDDRMIYASRRISLTSDKHILTAVQQELHLTERTFQRLFEQQIGISPNLFRRVNQFNRAFQQINSESFQDLSAVAYQHGYADQSHLNRAFKEFTNLTPTSYLNLRPGA